MKRLLILTCILSGLVFVATGGFLQAEITATAPSAKTIIVKSDHNFPPYEFVKDGVSTGYNIEIIRAVAKNMGMEVQISLGPWNAVRAELEQGHIDAIAGMFYSEERDKLVDFSQPYIKVFHSVFAQTDSGIESFADLKDKKVVVQQGDIMNDYLVQVGITGDILTVESPEKALRMLAAGKSDAAVLGKLQGLYLSRQYRLEDVAAVGVPFAPRSYCVAVKEGDSALRERFNEGLAIIRATGEYQEIYNKWFGDLQVPSLYEKWYPVGILFMAGLGILLLIAMVWLWTLRIKVDSRTKELRDELRQRKIAEARLRESDERLKGVFSSMSDLVFTLDQEGRFIDFFQPADMADLYVPPEQFLGKRIFDVMPPEISRAFERGINDAVARDKTSRIHYNLPIEGSEKWYSANISVRHDITGAVVGTTLVIRDVTREQLYERVLKIERDISIELGWAEDLHEALDKVTQATLRFPGIDAVAVLVVDALQANLSLVSSSGFDKKFADKLAYFPAGSPEYLEIMGGKPVYCDVHTPVLESMEPLRREMGLKAVMIIPVLHRGNAVASLHVASHVSEEFTPQTREALMLIAQRISGVLERIRAYGAVRSSENKFRSIIEQASEGIVLLENDGTIIDWNNAAIDITGLRREDVFGQTMDIVLGSLAAGDAEDFSKAINTVAAREQANASFQSMIQHRSGTQRYLRTTVFPIDIKGELLFGLVLHDLTDMRKASEDLRKSEELFRKSFRTSPDTMMINRISDGLYVDVNDTFVATMGYERHEALGKTSLELNFWRLPEKRQIYIDLIHQHGFVQNHEVEFLDKYGNIHWMLMSGTVIDLQGEPHTLNIARDITEIKRAENERMQVEAQLRHQQKLESIGTLASGVAHEINNPLNIVMNYAQLILDSATQDSAVESNAKEIISESERIAGIVRSLLAFSRKEVEFHSSADMGEIIRDTLSLVQRIFTGNQIQITLDIPDNVPKVICKRQSIQQVLMNLFTNARDALNEKYPKFHENKKLNISVQTLNTSEGMMLRTTVHDTGKGIPKPMQEQIFDPFFTTKSRALGTGLGLSVSLGIVRENGGVLSCESQDGEYTSMFMDLPAAEDTATE